MIAAYLFDLAFLLLFIWISSNKYSSLKYDYECLKEEFDDLQKKYDNLRITREIER